MYKLPILATDNRFLYIKITNEVKQICLQFSEKNHLCCAQNRSLWRIIALPPNTGLDNECYRYNIELINGFTTTILEKIIVVTAAILNWIIVITAKTLNWLMDFTTTTLNWPMGVTNTIVDLIIGCFHHRIVWDNGSYCHNILAIWWCKS